MVIIGPKGGVRMLNEEEQDNDGMMDISFGAHDVDPMKMRRETSCELWLP